jgi:chloramphenicol 3-O phosphotransferase
MNSVVIVLNGASSAGKTSIAQAIQRLSGTPTLHAALDTFIDMFHWPAIADQDEKFQCHATGVSNFHAALPILTANRFLIVVDHVFERNE